MKLGLMIVAIFVVASNSTYRAHAGTIAIVDDVPLRYGDLAKLKSEGFHLLKATTVDITSPSLLDPLPNFERFVVLRDFIRDSDSFARCSRQPLDARVAFDWTSVEDAQNAAANGSLSFRVETLSTDSQSFDDSFVFAEVSAVPRFQGQSQDAAAKEISQGMVGVAVAVTTPIAAGLAGVSGLVSLRRKRLAADLSWIS